jgi:hypothetical protein
MVYPFKVHWIGADNKPIYEGFETEKEARNRVRELLNNDGDALVEIYKDGAPLRGERQLKQWHAGIKPLPDC